MQGRAKGSVRRRPQSRSARHQSAQSSVEEGGDGPALSPSLPSLALPNPGQLSQNPASLILPNSTTNSALRSSSPSQPPLTEVSPRPSVLTLPVSTNPVKKDSSKGSSKPQVLPSPDEDDLFGSDSLFGSTSVSKHTASPSTPTNKTAQDKASGSATSKKEKERGTAPSLFDDHDGDLFQKVKPKSANKKAKASSFMEEDDDEEDIFGISNSSTPTSTASKDAKTSSSLSKQDIFQVLLLLPYILHMLTCIFCVCSCVFLSVLQYLHNCLTESYETKTRTLGGAVGKNELIPSTHSTGYGH